MMMLSSGWQTLEGESAHERRRIVNIYKCVDGIFLLVVEVITDFLLELFCLTADTVCDCNFQDGTMQMA